MTDEDELMELLELLFVTKNNSESSLERREEALVQIEFRLVSIRRSKVVKKSLSKLTQNIYTRPLSFLHATTTESFSWS